MFTPHNFIDNLKYLGFGMLGIFVVIGIIIAITYLLSYVSTSMERIKKQYSDNNENNDNNENSDNNNNTNK